MNILFDYRFSFEYPDRTVVEGKEMDSTALLMRNGEEIFDNYNLVYDTRTCHFHKLPKNYLFDDAEYRKYLRLLQEVLNFGADYATGDDPSTKKGLISQKDMSNAHYLVAAGYIPVAVEPTFTSGNFSTQVEHALIARDIPYLIRPTVSFVPQDIARYSGAKRHDIWVHRMDMAEVLGGKATNITTFDVIKEFGLHVISN